MAENQDILNSKTFIIKQDNYTALPFGEKHDSLLIIIPITVIYVIIFITGIVGNVCTCIIIAQNKSMRTATNYFLFSLAVSDLLLLVSGLPQEMFTIWCKYPYVFGEVFCVIRGLAAETSANASVLTIVSFTIERYLAICHPFLSYTMSKLSRAVKIIVFIWLIAIATALPQALQFGLQTHRGVVLCLQTKVLIAHSFELSTFLFFCAPMILITVLYILIGIKLRQARKARTMSVIFKHTEKGILTKKYGRTTRRVVKMLIAVVVAFFICWAPFHAQRLVAIYGTNENYTAKSPTMLFLYELMTYTSGVLYYFSTTVNPILYHTMSKKFQDAFKATLSRWRHGACSDVGGCSPYSSVIAKRQNTPESNSGTNGKYEQSRYSNGFPLIHDSERTITSISLMKQESNNSLMRTQSVS